MKNWQSSAINLIKKALLGVEDVFGSDQSQTFPQKFLLTAVSASD
jgi:hypothetical protein